MAPDNQSKVSEFIILGITNDPVLQQYLFISFLFIYLVTVFSNSTIMIIILIINDLHSPMYFFLSNLSFSDLCYSSVVTPKMLCDLFLKSKRTISFVGCVLQLYFFAVFASNECYILSAMAYDRYVAICHPLLYVLIMNKRRCVIVILIVYMGGLCTAVVHTSCTFVLSFCGPNIINHFYCDIPPLMELSCSDTYVSKTVIFSVVFCLGLLSVMVILASYFYILFTIMNIRPSEGRHRAFSTCSSHVLCVALFYGTVFFMYLRPASNYSVTQNKVVSVFYTMVIPMMNPIIYCLRNTEVKHAVPLHSFQVSDRVVVKQLNLTKKQDFPFGPVPLHSFQVSDRVVVKQLNLTKKQDFPFGPVPLHSFQVSDRVVVKQLNLTKKQDFPFGPVTRVTRTAILVEDCQSWIHALRVKKVKQMNNCFIHTANSEFIFGGVTNQPSLKVPLFLVFLLFYIIAVLGNVAIIATIQLDAGLHTPMYFFVSQLAMLDLFYTSIITPNTLVNLTRSIKSISIAGCGTQLLLFGGSATTESYLLAAMAYDRFVAVCQPLLYITIMSSRLCKLLVGGAYFAGFLNSVIHISLTFALKYWKANIIDHFYCDIPPLFKLTCSDTFLNRVIIFIFGGVPGAICLSTILYSYLNILITILTIQSGRRKAFSTCASHLLCVSIFYCSLMLTYLRGPSDYLQINDKIISIFYTVVIPTINPMIYSLRNTEVKVAFRKIANKYKLFSVLQDKRYQMAMWNGTNPSYFVLLGLANSAVIQIFLFHVFILFYSMTILANITIMVAIATDSRLHTPMYFFINNLAFLDLCYSTIITPKTLDSLVSATKTITFFQCAMQMYLFGASVSLECFLLGIMAYDRYVAICNPLLYMTVMNKGFCRQLVATAYVGGYLNAAIHTSCTFQLPFCKSNIIDHFYCDVPPLLKLSCVDTTINELLMFIFGGLAELGSFTTIMVSYTYIISTILKVHSQQSRKKAFSTCTSHLMTVCLFYSTIVFMYMRPSSTYFNSQDIVASVFYTLIIPMVNPLIYSLRNKDVARSLLKMIETLASEKHRIT
ncbi:uncharacterized protein PAF06_005741 [Gastrophryne carolinensis]